MRKFLVRLLHAGLISETDLRRDADRVGAVVEPEDLGRGLRGAAKMWGVAR